MPQNPMDQRIEDIVVQLERRRDRAQTIIDMLGSSGAWDMVLEDFEVERKRLDDTWHLVTKEKDWYEFRVTKMAVLKIVNLLEDYKHDRDTAVMELRDILNPDGGIVKDFDNQ